MNIPEAIEILEILASDKMPPDIDDFNKALDLGIEALKATQLLQKQWPHLTQLKLPGETPEENPLPRLASAINHDLNLKRV